MAIIEYKSLDDRALAQLVVEGDNAAFDALFTRHRDTLYSMLIKRSRNANDVNDLLQESFMKAYLHINSYSPSYDFGAWICAIAKNALVDLHRSRRNKPLNPNTNLSLDGNQIPSPSPEESFISAQRQAQIDRYIAMLPDDYRHLFKLRFIDEYSYEEIAEALKMKLGTVKTRIFRVRAMLCRMITEGDHLE
jgi:RNA polymerase sigma-70 factor (ECF subfamily)